MLQNAKINRYPSIHASLFFSSVPAQWAFKARTQVTKDNWGLAGFELVDDRGVEGGRVWRHFMRSTRPQANRPLLVVALAPPNA